MKNKLPSFQFYPGDWLKDANLRRCSANARAFWIDLLCLMFECEDRGVLATKGEPWSDEEIARSIPGDTYQNLLALQELIRNQVCRKNRAGSVYSRRMIQDDKERKRWVKSKKSQRVKVVKCPANVPPNSRVSSSSSSSSSSNSKAEAEEAAAFRDLGFEKPIGQIAFKQVWVRHHKTPGEWLTDKLEAAIQECQKKEIGIPPPFYEAKHYIEKLERAQFDGKHNRIPIPM